MSARLDRAIARIDAVHATDPSRDEARRPRELVYAEHMSRWLGVLAPDAGEALVLAVRAQHLARWRSPREAFPGGRAGYLAWRKAAGERHAADVGAILREEGYDDAVVERVASIVMKKARGRDVEAQTLEDCACLTFLELDFAPFAAQHEDAKVIDILRKTWGKMSSRARDLARGVALGPREAALLHAALAG